jgi:hypothetical protein
MTTTLRLLFSLVFWLFIGCGTAADQSPTVVLTGETVDVACGMCIYQMPNSNGCYWAADINGQHYVVQGNLPKAHENHAPDGMCNMPREAVIDGTIEGNQIFAKRFTLVAPEKVPQKPEFTPADIH